MFHIEAFQNPAPSYGIHPFWFWNGEMEDRQIIHQIHEMADKGVGGFFICPRQGLMVPYLSDAWFRKVKLAVETAASRQMEVWLYDEYPYPSGIAGGEVTLAHPEAKHYTLVHRMEKIRGGQTSTLELPWARLLSAKAVPVHMETGERAWDQALDISANVGNHQAERIFQKAGLTAYNKKRFFTYKTVKKLHWTAPEGEWEIHCFLEEEIEDFKYYGTFVDPCNEEAMKTFIALTHERYALSIGEHFGSTVKGVFTDEIGLLGKVPWSPQIPAYFKERNGYDLQDHLHALLYQDSEHSAKVRYDYYQTVHLLLRTAYHKQVHDWCEKYGLRYVAEVPSVRMTTQLYSHVPGGDSGHEKLGRSLDWILDRYGLSLRYNPKMISSLGNQLARERVLIECFHSVGWSMTLQDAKWMIDRLAAMGTNFFNFHAFFYTLDGLTKHDAPPSQFLQNPYWKHFNRLADYVKRISYVMSSGCPVRSIAVVDPTTTFWTHMGNPLHEFQYGGQDEEEKQRLERLKRHWLSICKALTQHRKDFDHLDPELLCEAEIADGVIRVGRAAYTVLVLPPLSNLESGAWEKIKAFLDQGGTVIANGLLPYESLDGTIQVEKEMLEAFGLDRPTGPDYWGDSQHTGAAGLVKGTKEAYFIGSDHTGELMSLLDSLLPAQVKLETDGKTPFLMQERRLEDDSRLVFISNQEGDEHQTFLDLGQHKQPIEALRLNLETGESEAVTVDRTEKRWRIPLYFAAYASYLIHIKEAAAADTDAQLEGNAWVWKLNAKEAWDIQPEQDNVIRFDTFELRLNTGNAWNERGTQVQVKTFIDQCEDIAGVQELSLQFKQLFGTPMKMQNAYPMRVQYTAEFNVEKLPQICYLLKDCSAIAGDYVIMINGHPVTEAHFQPKLVYDYKNQGADIQAFIREGSNILTVEVTVEHDCDGLVDALYICGDFGVHFTDGSSPVLGAAPKLAELHAGPYQGYVYYAGTLTFKRKVTLAMIPVSREFVVRFTDWDADFHDCAEVFVNGHSLGVQPWTPYEWKGSSSLLAEGENIIEVKVTNTLIGMLEGKYFDYESHSLEEVCK
ncbi:glycosyl hydrolase [Paenibacillus abyssi]|uniref:Glycoside hydrolase n=1 Tax=Paenibacillus abyssi TaxID=1340531 RepID=A0A917G6R2_9BACL|nr:glycosyl hydrolase [Paenibacillus abyssi]GGG25549.1 glycoside hydrolase [Paenibacillus abyssi]